VPIGVGVNIFFISEHSSGPGRASAVKFLDI